MIDTWILARCTTCGNERLYCLDRSAPDEDPCDCRPLLEQAVLPIDGGPLDG